jgi:hypothetical protein
MPDYTIGIAERIASLPDSYATSNSVNRNYFQETSQSVVNTVNVAIAPAAPTALDPTPQTTYATATDDNSVDTFGVQETPIVITLLATIADAGALAQYLIRSVPAYWFSNLAISLNTLSDANKNIVANLEIGQQIAVTKTFPAGVVPQTVTEYLFVEGISHNITVESHVVTIYTGPASTYLQWVLGNYTTTQTRTNILTNPNFEVSVNGWNTSNTSVARVTTDSYLGVASMSIGITVAATDARVGQTQNWDAIAGVTYTGSVYLKNTAGNNRQMNVSLRYVNSGGVTISEIFGTAQSTTVGGAWTRFTVTGLAPALTTNADLLIYPNTTNASLTNVTLADAALVEVSGSALPYFDGTYKDAYTGYTLTYQAWNGTADTSTSTTVWGLNTSGTGSALGDTTYGLA